MKKTNYRLPLAVAMLLLPIFLFSQNYILLPDYLQLEPDLPYDEDIPSPSEHLGYELGTAFTLYHQVVDYFETLDAASDRITLGNYGATYEGRPLIYAIITSEENHENLEDIRQNNLRLADPLNTSAEEAESIMEDHPVVVSFSYNIHGNEASSTEAAMQVAYRLAAATDSETEELLDDLVFIMFPTINPDGRDRYVYWYKSMRRSIPGIEPKDLEHYAPWPNGRTNHYWFDLNRDWIWGVHPESRGHTRIYQEWMPQVHTDYHEQGYNSNYFTMPGTTPRNLLLPDNYEALSDTFGRANIAEFDKHKMNYFTREAFDFYYPGYGSSYPSVLGAIGMLTEQGGIGGGRAIETDDGYVLTLRQRLFDHYTTSLATLRKAAERKQLFQQYTYEALNPANAKAETQAYILPNDETGYLTDVIAMLLRNDVQVEQATGDFTAFAKNYRTGEVETTDFSEGDYVISTNQNRHLFLNSVMGRNLEIEDSVMYDMATWSAPLAYNLEAHSTTRSLSVSTEVIKEAPAPPSGVENSDAGYAYVIDWKQRYAPRALSMLWKKGYRVRSVSETFSNGQHEFSEGSLVVLLGRNRDKLENVEEDMAEIAETTQVRIHGFDTGRMPEGIDLASRSSHPIKQPKVALLVESPFNTYTSGQIYFLFDQETQLPVERIRTSVLQQTSVPKFGQRYGLADLNEYDVLILPDGGSGLRQVFEKEALEQLKAWVSGGGVLIATEDSGSFFTKEVSKLTEVEYLESPKDSSETALYLPYGERRDYYGKKYIPGSALKTHLDTSHPLAFGMPKELYTLKFGVDALKPSADLQTVGYYDNNAEDLLIAGYASDESLDVLAGNTFAAVQQMGQGKIVFLLENTQYRMFWVGPARMMQNAVMLLPGM